LQSADGDETFTVRQNDAAKALLPFTLPKLQAVSVKHELTRQPPILDTLADASVETLQILCDALLLCGAGARSG
jgi:hypothetical protein